MRAFLLLPLLWVGCQPPNGGDAAASAATENPLGDVASVPYVEVETADALVEQIRAVGAETVVVNFWATWCGPCRVEFPDLIRYDDSVDGEGIEVRFVSVDLPTDADLVQDFLDEQGVDEPSFLFTGYGDVIGMLDPRMGNNVPVTMVFDGEGELLKSHLGMLSFEGVKDLVAEARAT